MGSCQQVIPSTCRAMVGQVAGGGRTEKPLLKAGNAYHKFRVKRNSWPKVGCYCASFVLARRPAKSCCAGHMDLGAPAACILQLQQAPPAVSSARTMYAACSRHDLHLQTVLIPTTVPPP